ncbi:MAG TPA: cysteine peptidase family C39 domain-containing protein [Bauldia sp.]|nr:cysteine peptidase family C39 domain-containing protein [Bauldia sp.]
MDKPRWQSTFAGIAQGGVLDGLRVLAVAGLTALGGFSASAETVKPVINWQDAKYIDVVRQRTDFSCGAASLATLINGYFGKKFTEQQILKIARARYSVDEWRVKEKVGLSVEDLAFIAHKLGFASEAAAIGISGLLQIKGPVVIHVNTGNYLHFTVFRGVKDGSILLADPVLGNVRYTPGRFKKEYTGIALAIWKEGTPLPKEYSLLVTAKDERSGVRQARDLWTIKIQPRTSPF